MQVNLSVGAGQGPSLIPLLLFIRPFLVNREIPDVLFLYP